LKLIKIIHKEEDRKAFIVDYMGFDSLDNFKEETGIHNSEVNFWDEGTTIEVDEKKLPQPVEMHISTLIHNRVFTEAVPVYFVDGNFWFPYDSIEVLM